MNVLTTRVALRERSLTEVFDLSLRFLVVRGGKKFLRLWLIACAPLLVGCVLLRVFGVEWVWVWLAAVAGFVIAQIPFTLAASRLLLGDELPLAGLVRTWLPRVPGQLFVHALAAVALGVSALVVVPAPLLAAQLVFLPEITLLEGSNVLRTYERGMRLARSRWGSAIGTCCLLLLLAAAFLLGAEVTGRAIQEDLLSLAPAADVLANGGSWFALLGFFASVPFVATARFLAYIDGRTRREAWDVQLRFTELASDAKGGA